MGKLDSIIDSSGSDNLFIAEVVSLYKTTSIEAIQLAFDSVEKNDRDTLKKSAHKIKGSSLNFGINAVSDLAKIIETEALTLPLEELRRKLTELQKINALLVQEIESELKVLQKN